MGENSPNEISLWESLHDGHIKRIESNALNRSIQLTLDSIHLKVFSKETPDLLWILEITGIKILNALRHEPWPGPIPTCKGLPYEEQEAVSKDYRSKARSVSADWSEFEMRVSTGSFSVYNASIQRSETGVTLRLSGEISESDEWFEVSLSGESISVARSDGGPMSFEDLLQLGSAYWEAFAARRKGKE